MSIVPQAVKEYVLYNTPVEDFVRNHTDIFDFYKITRVKKDAHIESHLLDKRSGGVNINKEQNIVRYYVSNEGVKLLKILPPLDRDKLTDTDKHRIKVNPNQLDIFSVVEDTFTIFKKRIINVEASYDATIANIHIDKDIQEYNINYDYYIREVYKLIAPFKDIY